MAPGIAGIPFAESTNPNFPDSYPTFASTPLEDGAFVFDTQIGVEITNPNPYSASFYVVTESFVPGTATILENVSGTVQPVSVPFRYDVSWSNSTVFAAPESSGSVELPLRSTSTQRSLELRVGQATWELVYLTPATAAVSGTYTNAGLWTFALLMAAATAGALLVVLFVAKGIALAIGRSPPVPFWWPVIWIAVPVMWFVQGFVSFTQTFGAASPAVAIPIPVALAVLPYLPRLFTRQWEMLEVEGVDPVTLDEAANPKAVLPVVQDRTTLRCAPQTWREALWSGWLGLPEFRGYEVKMPGGSGRVQPRLLRVENPLSNYYRAEVTASCWYDVRRGISRPRHRLEWKVTEQVPMFAADGVTPAVTRPKRRFSPHLVAGYLEAVYPPKLPVALYLAGVQSVETSAHDAEVLALENSRLIAKSGHDKIEALRENTRTLVRFYEMGDRPRSPEEVARLVLATQRRTAKAPETEEKG